MLDQHAPIADQLDQWPASPQGQIALADDYDAQARAAEARAELTRDYHDWRALLESAVDLRQLAVQLRDAAWRQVGA